MVALQIDARQLAKLQRYLGNIKDGVPKAVSRGINRALNKGRTEIKREIRRHYVIKAKDIQMKVIGAALTRLGGKIIVHDTMLDLAKFKVTPKTVQRRKNKRIIRATVKVGGGKLIPHAFIAQMPSGYIGPFERRGRERLPIDKLLAIGAGIMASQPSVGPRANKAMGDALAKTIDQQIKFLMSKR